MDMYKIKLNDNTEYNFFGKKKLILNILKNILKIHGLYMAIMQIKMLNLKLQK